MTATVNIGEQTYCEVDRDYFILSRTAHFDKRKYLTHDMAEAGKLSNSDLGVYRDIVENNFQESTM